MLPVRAFVAIALTLALAIPAGLTLSLSDAAGPRAPAAANDADDVIITNHTLDTAPGVTIAFTTFQPVNASASSPTPLVLHSHGWGGSRATSVGGIVEDLTDAGFGVLSFDARGHGDSTGYATIQHKDHEIQDYIKLLDWVYDNLNWTLKEGDPADKDTVLGAVGGSYGGGYQLMTASYDDRLDAIVPQMTWNDLRYSLAPGGVVKSTWVDALYGFGLQGVNMHPDIHQWFLAATATNQLPAGAMAHLAGSSPVPAAIDAATLLVQGLPDALFNWNEAVANYDGIRANGNPDVALVGYLGGHVLPYPGQPVGAIGPARGAQPCGAYNDLALAWFDKHLSGNASAAVPEGVTYALEDGGCVAADDAEAGSIVSRSFVALAGPSTAGTLVADLDAPAGNLTGIPHISGTFIGATESILSFGLVYVRADGRVHVVDDQAAFLRITPTLGSTSTAFDLDMTGVATTIAGDGTLLLRIDGLHEWAPTGAARTPGGGALVDVTVTLPYA